MVVLMVMQRAKGEGDTDWEGGARGRRHGLRASMGCHNGKCGMGMWVGSL